MKCSCVCGKEFNTIRSRGSHRAHCKDWKQYKIDYLKDKKFCLNCGKELTDSQNWKGFKYCCHECYLESKDHPISERLLALNRRNPYFNFKQFNKNNESEFGILYFIKIGNKLKLGSTKNIYKRLRELQSYNENIVPIRVLLSDSLLITYSETLILNNFDNDHEFMEYSQDTALSIINILDNLVAWLSVNNYMNEYQELLGDHNIRYVDIDINNLYSGLSQDTLENQSSDADMLKLKTYDDHLEFQTEFEDYDRLFTLSNGLVTHNCRLRIDLRELVNASSGLFGSGDSTGSIGVVTLNLSRIGYMARVLSDFDEDSNYEWDRSSIMDPKYCDKLVVNASEEFKKVKSIISNYPELSSRIDMQLEKKDSNTKLVIYTMIIQYFMDLARKSLIIKRGLVQKSMDSGLLPYTKRYLGTIDNHFNTIGVNAGHEMCLNMIDQGIDTKDGKNLALYTLNYILNRLSDYQEEDNGKLLWNCEATPAEGASTRFAKGDRADFKGIITGGGTNLEFYTNSTQLPDSYTDNVYEVFDHQNDLQVLYTSGTVQHIYMNEPVHDWRVVQSLVKKLFTNYRLPYISISPNITICPICGKLLHTKEWCDNYHDPNKVKELIKLGVITEEDVQWDNDDNE